MTNARDKKTKNPKSLKALENDPRVYSISIEPNGIWVNLEAGYVVGGEWGEHSIHEDTVRDCLTVFKGIRSCGCDDCKKEIN